MEDNNDSGDEKEFGEPTQINMFSLIVVSIIVIVFCGVVTSALESHMAKQNQLKNNVSTQNYISNKY